MLEEQSKAIRRVDYTAPAFWIDTVDLTFDLDPSKTRVLNKMRVRRNSDVAAQALRLDGEDLNLARVMVNGAGTSFKMDGKQLVLENLPEGNEAFDLEIFTTCNPSKNTQLSGLYVSNDSFFTQCEAEGFRRITYFLDRPDVMASYTVTLRADAQLYPVLLSNGNLVEQGALEEGRHFAKWTDPHKAMLSVCFGRWQIGSARAAHCFSFRQRTLASGFCSPRRFGQNRTCHEFSDGQCGLG